MSSSGAYSFSPTFLTCINKALRILKVTQQGQQSGTYQNALASAQEAGELILIQWATNKIPVWSKFWFTKTITTANYSPYSVGPGRDIDLGNATPSLAPVDILKCYYVYATSGVRVELNCIADLDYSNYALQQSFGIPNSFYYMKQQAVSNGSYGLLNFYPIASASSIGDSFNIQFQRYLYSGGVTSNNLDFPLEFNKPFAWAIAKEIMLEYEQSRERQQLILAMYQEAMEDANLSNSDGGSVFFIPDTRYEE